MDYTRFIKGLRDAYEHRAGIRTLRLGTLDPTWFAEIQNEVAFIVEQSGSSDVTAASHVTNWTRPKGTVRQFSLFNVSGQSDDYKGDYGYLEEAARKRLVFPQLKAISRFAALFGGNLRNLRLNGMGTDSSLSAHEENSITPRHLSTGYIVRFHLPIFSTDQSFIYLDDERFIYREGELYFFHHGCVHAASNAAQDVRYHLVLDCFLDRTLFRNLFPGTPGTDLGLRKSLPNEAVVVGEPFIFPEFVCEDGRIIKNGIKYGRKAPTALDFYKRHYPSLFRWLPDFMTAS